MKNFFTLLILSAIAFGVNAQSRVADKHTVSGLEYKTNQTFKSTPGKTKGTKDGEAIIVLTAGDVWGDGTGYQLLLDSDATESDTITSNVDCGRSYDNWEYKIPTDATSDDANVVVNASEQITIPAGTYDYIVLNPGCTDFGIIYLASDQCDESVGNDYTFEAGKIYTFTATLVSPNDCITITIEDVPTEPTITADPTSLMFAGILGEGATDAQTSIITTFDLTEDVTATTASPFEVSSDGTTFGTTATIDAAGGTLYTRYTPSAAGEELGTVSLASTDVSTTIDLVGNGVDCSDITLPLEQSFEDNSVMCWSAMHASTTPNNPLGVTSDTSHIEGDYAWIFSSYNTNTDGVYDQYLITPELPVSTNDLDVSFYYMDFAGYGDELFKVGYSSTTDDISEFTWEDEVSTAASTDWVNYTMTAPSGTKFVAIHYYSDYQYYLVIDDITIQTAVGVSNIENSTIAVFPNPANNVVTIENAENANITVLNMLGQVVAMQVADSNRETIDVSELAEGTYVVRIANGAEVKTHKLSIVK